MKKFLALLIGFLSFVGYGFGLTISPFRFEYNINPGQTVSGKIVLKNDETNPITLYTSKADFTAEGETGIPKFIEPKDNISGTYGLSSWIKVAQDHITLAPGESREVNFEVSVPKDAEPGGHYGAVFFGGAGADAQIGVKSRLGVLYLIDVAGDVKVDGNLVSFDMGTFTGSKFFAKEEVSGFPISFGIRFKNSGNVHLKPTGKITILDDKGNKLEKIGKENRVNAQGVSIGEDLVNYIPVNDVAGNVLPDSERVFESIWNGFGYNVLDEQGKQIVKFRNLQEYYADQAAQKKQYLKFWETIREHNVKRKFVANLEVSYKGKDGQDKSFNSSKEFYVTYNETVVGFNYYILGGIIIVVLGLGYYMIIGRKRAEAKLREKIMKEMGSK